MAQVYYAFLNILLSAKAPARIKHIPITSDNSVFSEINGEEKFTLLLTTR